MVPILQTQFGFTHFLPIMLIFNGILYYILGRQRINTLKSEQNGFHFQDIWKLGRNFINFDSVSLKFLLKEQSICQH